MIHLEALKAAVEATQGPVPLGLGRLTGQEKAVADRW